MLRQPPRSTQSRSSAASDVYKRQTEEGEGKPAVRGVAIAERGDRPADTLVENTREEWTPGSGAAAGADRQSLARAARGVRDDNWERLALSLIHISEPTRQY